MIVAVGGTWTAAVAIAGNSGGGAFFPMLNGRNCRPLTREEHREEGVSAAAESSPAMLLEAQPAAASIAGGSGVVLASSIAAVAAGTGTDACGGAWAAARPCPPMALLAPKSDSFTTPVRSRRRFPHLTSLCSTACACRYARPARSCRV